MYRRSWLAAFTILGALASSFAACGGGGGLARSDLVRRADAICASAQKAASAVLAPTNLTDPNAAASYFGAIAPITDKETTQLDRLRPVRSVADEWSAFISAQKSANDLLRRIEAKAQGRKTSGLQDLGQVPAVGQRVQLAATRLGARACAQ